MSGENRNIQQRVSRELDLQAIKDNMPIRIMDFDIDPQLVRDALPEVFPAYGVSLTLPYLEPYLVRTMREALKHCTDPLVAQEVRQFIGQEAQHYRQHAILNDIIRSVSPELEGLRKIEEQMEADYQRFTKTKSLKFNLAYAEGFEAATFAGGQKIFEFKIFDRLESLQGSGLLRLFKWHALEEIEHRTVTFNIYQHLYGGYWYRLIAGAFGQYHFFKYVFLFSWFMAKNAPQALEQGRTLIPTTRVVGSWRERLSLLGYILRVYSPFYDPAKLSLPESVHEHSRQFTDEASDIR